MPLFNIGPDNRTTVTVEGKKRKIIAREKLDSFDSKVLGLGDIGARSSRIEGICAIFDLQGFTDFCKQVDPRLVVPEFLSKFLDWFYATVKSEIVHEEYPEGFSTFCDPPILSKFMGDGIMLIWDAG